MSSTSVSERKNPGRGSTYQEPLKKLVSPADTSDVSMEFCMLQREARMIKQGSCETRFARKAALCPRVPGVQFPLVGRRGQHERRGASGRHLAGDKTQLCFCFFVVPLDRETNCATPQDEGEGVPHCFFFSFFSQLFRGPNKSQFGFALVVSPPT